MNRVLLTMLTDAYNLVETVMDELPRKSPEHEEVSAVWAKLESIIKKYSK